MNPVKVSPVCYLITTVGKVTSDHNMLNYARVEQLVPSMHESEVGRGQTASHTGSCCWLRERGPALGPGTRERI